MGYPNGPGMMVEEALRTDPAAQDFAREVALPNYLRDRIPTTATDPNMFLILWLVVFIMVTGSRFIMWLMWMEDCYADTNADTDGDGMLDWIECRLAFDLDNGGERSNSNGDPDGDGYTNEQECVAVTDFFDSTDMPDGSTPPLVDLTAPSSRDDL
jgi:hypothetical protein